MKKIKIAIHSTGERTSTDFYRCRGPLGELAKQDKVELIPIDIDNFEWNHIWSADILFMHNPHKNECVNVAEAASSMGTPIVVDWDDAPFNVERDNKGKTFEIFHSPTTISNIKLIINMCSILTTSTQGVLDSLFKGGAEFSKACVIKNAFIDRYSKKLLKDSYGPPINNPLVFWRGGANHRGALIDNAPEIIRMIKENNDATLMLMSGEDPIEITEKLEFRCLHTYNKPRATYFDLYRSIMPMVSFIVSRETVFALAKSHNPFLEATLLGHSVFIAPKFHPEFKDLPCELIEPNQLSEKVREIFDLSDEQRNQKVKTAREYIYENFSLEKMNAKRLEVFESLI